MWFSYLSPPPPPPLPLDSQKLSKEHLTKPAGYQSSISRKLTTASHSPHPYKLEQNQNPIKLKSVKVDWNNNSSWNQGLQLHLLDFWWMWYLTSAGDFTADTSFPLAEGRSTIERSSGGWWNFLDAVPHPPAYTCFSMEFLMFLTPPPPLHPTPKPHVSSPRPFLHFQYSENYLKMIWHIPACWYGSGWNIPQKGSFGSQCLFKGRWPNILAAIGYSMFIC